MQFCTIVIVTTHKAAFRYQYLVRSNYLFDFLEGEEYDEYEVEFLPELVNLWLGCKRDGAELPPRSQW